MSKDTVTSVKISSFAAPTEADIAAFSALSDEEKRRLIEAELEKGLLDEAEGVTVADIIARVKARRVRG